MQSRFLARRSLCSSLLLTSLLLTSAALSYACSSTVASETGSTTPGEASGSGESNPLLPLTWDGDEGRLLLTVPELERPLLWLVSLPQGLGSNDVGLDRGQLGTQQLVEFRRQGERLFLVAPNLKWRTTSSDELVRDGVQRAFAESVLASFEIVDEVGGSPRIDATGFFQQDAHGIVGKLSGSGQGDFSLDASRSFILTDSLKSFPGNISLEVLQTFASRSPGREVRSTTPQPTSVSLRIRHAFIALPNLEQHDYRVRAHHPRSGFFTSSWNDANTPLGEETQRRVVQRHHITPDAPLVYYIDRAAPEPMRTALLEGAKYWEPIFDQAVFPGAFRVELLPVGADPDDVRWNILQWVERSTRGWSYGTTVSDPRTGEILKGHVTLGALRVRQDVLLFEGLVGPWVDGKQDVEVTEAALARIRQLAAHEIGHTLGLAHNFAASVDERASVMDYPAPRVTLKNGQIDLSDAYADGCGPWDLQTIRYGYGLYKDDAVSLPQVLGETARLGLHYASDEDARGNDRAHPAANLWDEGSDPVAQLQVDLEVRSVALAGFTKAVLEPTRPRFDMERVLVPLYLRHRFQVEAVARQVGGRVFDYPLAMEAVRPITPVAAKEQARALSALYVTLEPAILGLSPALVASIPPPPPGYSRGRESFRATGPMFDPLEAAATAADVTLDLLFNPARCSRLVDQHAADAAMPGFETVCAELMGRWFPDDMALMKWSPVEEVVRARFIEHLIALAAGTNVPDRVRAIALATLEDTLALLGDHADNGAEADSQRLYRDRIGRFLRDPIDARERRPSPIIPPGSPIGMGAYGCSLSDR
ncbi:MAG: hypothetical protein ACI8QS_001172 [Planctomycetota bacterium]|jgi:hypothetical protein